MNTDSVTAQVSEDLTQFFDHWGIERAHVGSAPIGDLVALVSARPDSVASVALVHSTRITADDRLVMFTGDQSPGAEPIACDIRSPEVVELYAEQKYDTAVRADYVKLGGRGYPKNPGYEDMPVGRILHNGKILW